MLRFAVYALFGFIELWLLLFAWGFSRGPADSLPYFALIGCLILVLMAAPLALLAGRLASALAVPASLLALASAAAALREGSLPGAVMFAALPVATCALAVRHLWSSRADRWLSHPSWPRLSARAGLALLPIAAFLLAFNERLVLALVLAGPSQ